MRGNAVGLILACGAAACSSGSSAEPASDAASTDVASEGPWNSADVASMDASVSEAAVDDGGAEAETVVQVLPASGLYACVEPVLNGASFPVHVYNAGTVAVWPLISGSYAIVPDGTVTWNGQQVATWWDTQGGFDVSMPKTALAGGLGPDASAIATICTLTAAEGDAGYTEDDGGTWWDAAWEGGVYPEPPDGSAVTWDDWVSGFANYYCQECHTAAAACTASRCHTPDIPSLYVLLEDMSVKQAWVDREAQLRCGIAATQDPSWNCALPARTFPKQSAGDPLPPDDERAIMVSWLSAGCP